MFQTNDKYNIEESGANRILQITDARLSDEGVYEFRCNGDSTSSKLSVQGWLLILLALQNLNSTYGIVIKKTTPQSQSGGTYATIAYTSCTEKFILR